MNSEGREEKFTIYWRNAIPIVSSYILSMIPNNSDHDDIMQNTAIAAFKKLDQYDESRPFTKWALGFARYEILAARGKYARNPIIFHDTLVETLMELYYEMEEELTARAISLKECINKLPKRNFEILKMRYEDTLPFDDIANNLNITHGAIRTQLSRIKKTLKECIEKNIKVNK